MFDSHTDGQQGTRQWAQKEDFRYSARGYNEIDKYL